MTREEARHWLEIELKTWEDECKSNHPIKEALSVAIKALEQEPVLDKIRAEIEQLRLHKAQFITSDNKVCIDSQEVLNIIDKYKSESEDKEYILNKI